MGIGAYAVEISNPDRIVFPDAGFSKADVVAYYERAAPLMMPHLMGRPLTLQRFPRGIGAKGFMQKNAAKHFPSFIERVPVVHQERETIYPVVHDAMGLRYLANQGTVTFHIWTTRARALDRPDHIVFDLDPPRGDPAAARTAARDVRTLLQELGLASAVCATGSQGYHVLFPVRPELDLVAIGLFCRRVAELLARRHPERLTTEFRKKNRRGRVFIDWLRNRHGQTVACPWSLRPRPGAPFVAPLTWDELATTPPDLHRLPDVEARLRRGDPYANLEPADLTAARDHVARATAGFDLKPFDRFRS